MKKPIVLALAVVIAGLSLTILLTGDGALSTGGSSYAQSIDAADAPTLGSLMRRGELALEAGEWNRADEFFERVLDINPEYAPAYLGKLLAELKIKSEADLVNHGAPLDDMLNYQRALRFADARYSAKVTGYNQAILARYWQVGAVMQFGGLEWRVLDVQNNRALIITEYIIEKLPYNEKSEAITWETCTLRKYLNGEFYAKFTKEEKERIAETRIINPDNLWYGTKGGADTTDKLFLLSFEEVDKYFGNSGDYCEKRRKNGRVADGKLEIFLDDNGPVFSNTNDNDRIAKFNKNEAWFWWLRSPGGRSIDAAGVGIVGAVGVDGRYASDVNGGVRPALFLIMP